MSQIPRSSIPAFFVSVAWLIALAGKASGDTVWNVNIGDNINETDNYLGAASENTVNSFWNSVTTNNFSGLILKDSTGSSDAGVTLDLNGTTYGSRDIMGDEIFDQYTKAPGNTTPFSLVIGNLSSTTAYDLIIYSDWYWKNGDSGLPVSLTAGSGLNGTIYVNRAITGSNGTVPALGEDTNPANVPGATNWYRLSGLTPDASGNLGFSIGGINGPFNGFQLIGCPNANLSSVILSPVTSLGATTATVHGEVTEVGISAPVITFYYGDEDGGQDAFGWDESVILPGTHNGDFSAGLSNLAPATTYFFNVLATNSEGSQWVAGSESFTTLPLPPEVVNSGPDLIEATSAEVGASVITTGGEEPDVTVYYGTVDGGEDIAFWQESVSLGVIETSGSVILSGLAEGTTYFYRAFANHSGGADWAPESSNFTTPVAALADVVSGTAIDIGASSARLRGTVLSIGNDTPSLTFYFGTSDGGASEGAWERSFSVGVGGVEFSQVVSLLTPETTYYFRVKAVNAAGTSWAPNSGVFTTTAVPVLGVVINEVHYDTEPKTEAAEFVELFNAGDVPVNLDGWRLSGVGNYVFPAGTSLPAGEYLVIAEDPATMQSKFGLNTSHQYSGALRNVGDDLRLIDSNGTQVDCVDYQSGFPWPTAARGTGSSMELIHPQLDNDLGASWRSSNAGQPTPGDENSIFQEVPTDAPPAIRQVSHSPQRPTTGEEVLITAKVTDPEGVGTVTLSYQLVDPGQYIRKSDAAFNTNWVDLPMSDDGSGGDIQSADSIFTVKMPASLQEHRRLVRYRITVEDGLGHQVRVPYSDDESPNFAYFVYDGVPAWTGAIQPGGASQTVPAEVMENAQVVYHLLANATDVTNSQYNGSSDGVRMSGTMVYNGVVYDHIEFYNRGEFSTYRSGKNKWRFKFNRARDFEARDLYGENYQSTWKTMNFNSCASPWLPSNRGIAGLDEAVPHRLHQLVGVPAPNTHWVHFRVIDGSEETPSDQYGGDLWGLYQAVQHLDGRFLSENNLPDGNVYKIERAVGDKKNQGPTQPLDSSDWNSFWNASANLNTVEWWRGNFNLDVFYGFRAINRATSNVDLGVRGNYFMYHNPDGRWQVVPWDLDMMYAPVEHDDGVIRAARCLDHPEISVEFKNRCRGLVDLLFSDADRHGGHAAQLVEELSQVVNPLGTPLTMVDVDEMMWSFHPRTASQHRGPWYGLSVFETTVPDYFRTIPTADHEGFQQSIIDFMHDTRTGGFSPDDRIEDGYGFGHLSLEAADGAIPQRPTISFSGGAGFPVNDLRFTSGAFSDPQGGGTFESMEWRVGEIYNPMTSGYVSGEPWAYEVTDVWQSGKMSSFEAEVSIPIGALRPGHTYRVRVRHWDDSGRASHWSEAVEFVAGSPEVSPYQNSLVISEIMYNPAGGSDHEFIEIRNVGPITLDLTGVRFTKGIDFDFPEGTMIAPNAYLVIVNNLAAFTAEYGTGIPVVGEWELGDRLSNGGENLKLSLGAGSAIHEFIYDDAHPWPTATDGGGYSLTLSTMESGVDHGDPAVWRASVSVGGSPGEDDGVTLNDWLAEQGLVPGDEFFDEDGDTFLTITEYAMGSNPNIVEATEAYAVVVNGGDAQFSFNRSRSADGVTVVPEYSFNLLNWSAAEIETSLDQGNGIDRITVRQPGNVGVKPRSFFRLKVTPR